MTEEEALKLLWKNKTCQLYTEQHSSQSWKNRVVLEPDQANEIRTLIMGLSSANVRYKQQVRLARSTLNGLIDGISGVIPPLDD